MPVLPRLCDCFKTGSAIDPVWYLRKMQLTAIILVKATETFSEVFKTHSGDSNENLFYKYF